MQHGGHITKDLLGPRGVPVGGGGALLDPLDLSPLLWLDASDATTLFQDAAGTTPAASNADSVGLWMDKSGNANHATAADAARPVLKTAAQNGLSAIKFDSANHILALTAGASYLDAVVVCAHDSATTFPAISVILGVITTTAGLFGGAASATTFYPAAGAAFAYRVGGAVSDDFAPLQTYKIAEQIILSGTPSATCIGRAGTSTSRRWDGDIAELILLSSALSDDDRQALGLYLKTKWNVVYSMVL